MRGRLPAVHAPLRCRGPNYAYRHSGYHNRGINFLYVDGHVDWSGPDTRGRDWYAASLNRHWNITRADVQP